MALEMRVIGVEPLRNELGMRSVLREDDGFTELFAIIDLQPGFHQMLEHLVHRVGIEQPFVQRRGLHGFGVAPSSSHSSASHFSLSSSESWS